MKVIFLLLLIFISTAAISQPDIDTITIPKPFTLVFIDSIPGIQDLYSKARLFFSENYNSAKAVIELEDAQAKYVVGKSVFNMFLHPFGNEKKKQQHYGDVYYKMKVECKGSKYRLTFYNMVHEAEVGQSVSTGGSLDNEYTKKTWLSPQPDVWLRIQRNTVVQCRELAASFKKYLTQPQTSF